MRNLETTVSTTACKRVLCCHIIYPHSTCRYLTVWETCTRHHTDSRYAPHKPYTGVLLIKMASMSIVQPLWRRREKGPLHMYILPMPHRSYTQDICERNSFPPIVLAVLVWWERAHKTCLPDTNKNLQKRISSKRTAQSESWIQWNCTAECAAISTATHNTCGLHIGKGVKLMNNFTHAHCTNARPECMAESPLSRVALDRVWWASWHKSHRCTWTVLVFLGVYHVAYWTSFCKLATARRWHCSPHLELISACNILSSPILTKTLHNCHTIGHLICPAMDYVQSHTYRSYTQDVREWNNSFLPVVLAVLVWYERVHKALLIGTDKDFQKH